MSDEPENLVLLYLRRIDSNARDIRVEIKDVQRRMTRLEAGLMRINRRLDITD